MVRKSLRERLNPKNPPTVFTTERTNPEFKHQILMIIHQYYDDENKTNSMKINGGSLQISDYSDEVMREFCKFRQDYHLPVDGQFGRESLYVNLEKLKNVDFFELLDCMIQVLSDETSRNSNEYVDYINLVDEINDSMRRNGIGFQIINGELNIQTEQKVFEEITKPCFMCLINNDFYDADVFINEAFEAYKDGSFEEAINNAYKALENVIYELCQMQQLDVSKNEKIPSMLRKLLKDEGVPNQINEHCDALVSIMQTAASIRNERAAHGREVKEISSALVRYTIDTVCVDILFLVRTFCEIQ
jgi:hypothetical protein